MAHQKWNFVSSGSKVASTLHCVRINRKYVANQQKRWKCCYCFCATTDFRLCFGRNVSEKYLIPDSFSSYFRRDFSEEESITAYFRSFCHFPSISNSLNTFFRMSHLGRKYTYESTIYLCLKCDRCILDYVVRSLAQNYGLIGWSKDFQFWCFNLFMIF